MSRIAIVVEGQTELEFVKRVLAPSFWEREVYLNPMLIGRSGGGVKVDRLAAYMIRNLENFDYVTSLVDFYGFQDKGNLTVDALEERVDEESRRRIRRVQAQSRVFAYVQLHEFEGLLFSDVSAFDRAIITPAGCVEQLRTIRENFTTPEDINDSRVTAPSKRIANVIPQYVKRVDGPMIAESIGLDRIRSECPRFNAWVERMESLGDAHIAND